MRSLPGRSRSVSGQGPSSQDGYSESTPGWEAQRVGLVPERQHTLIRAANQQVSLTYAFRKHQVSLEESYSSSGWTWNGRCPFPDHRDTTPSFGYNPQQNVFNCFGCHRKGGVVDFLAEIEGRPRYQVATELLRIHGISDLAVDEEFDLERFKQILFNHAQAIYKFKKKHQNSQTAIQYAQDSSWVMDLYLRNNPDISGINLDNLEARAKKIEEQLELFEEK